MLDTKYDLYEVLRHLVTTLTLARPLDEMLHTLATLTSRALKLDLCVVLLQDSSHTHLRVSTWATDPGDNAPVLQPVSISQALWEQLYLATRQGQLPQLTTCDLEALNPVKDGLYQTFLPVPLVAGSECIGLLNCYARASLNYDADDELMLHTIANQAALAIKHRLRVEDDTQTQKGLIRAFVTALCEGVSDGEEGFRRQAHFLGFDLAWRHVVALLELSELDASSEHDGKVTMEERSLSYKRVIGSINLSLQERYPGSLVDVRHNQLVCLLCLDNQDSVEQLNTWVNQLVCQVQDEHRMRITAGIGNLCNGTGDYVRSHAEAKASLEVGQCLSHKGCSRHFNALGAYRYLYRFASTDTLQDQYQEQIAIIVEYDQRKKASLLDTLDVYLECGGSITRTSSYLDVHRNTLLQRLERIQKLCALDLERLQNRLPLLIALKVHKLRTHGGNVGDAGNGL